MLFSLFWKYFFSYSEAMEADLNLPPDTMGVRTKSDSEPTGPPTISQGVGVSDFWGFRAGLKT